MALAGLWTPVAAQDTTPESGLPKSCKSTRPATAQPHPLGLRLLCAGSVGTGSYPERYCRSAEDCSPIADGDVCSVLGWLMSRAQYDEAHVAAPILNRRKRALQVRKQLPRQIRRTPSGRIFLCSLWAKGHKAVETESFSRNRPRKQAHWILCWLVQGKNDCKPTLGAK
jgi:hypothetical protein